MKNKTRKAIENGKVWEEPIWWDMRGNGISIPHMSDDYLINVARLLYRLNRSDNVLIANELVTRGHRLKDIISKWDRVCHNEMVKLHIRGKV